MIYKARNFLCHHLVIAQLVERWTVEVTVNPSVVGSIPTRETSFLTTPLLFQYRESSSWYRTRHSLPVGS